MTFKLDKILEIKPDISSNEMIHSCWLEWILMPPTVPRYKTGFPFSPSSPLKFSQFSARFCVSGQSLQEPSRTEHKFLCHLEFISGTLLTKEIKQAGLA